MSLIPLNIISITYIETKITVLVSFFISQTAHSSNFIFYIFPSPALSLFMLDEGRERLFTNFLPTSFFARSNSLKLAFPTSSPALLWSGSVCFLVPLEYVFAPAARNQPCLRFLLRFKSNLAYVFFASLMIWCLPDLQEELALTNQPRIIIRMIPPWMTSSGQYRRLPSRWLDLKSLIFHAHQSQYRLFNWENWRAALALFLLFLSVKKVKMYRKSILIFNCQQAAARFWSIMTNQTRKPAHVFWGAPLTDTSAKQRSSSTFSWCAKFVMLWRI